MHTSMSTGTYKPLKFTVDSKTLSFDSKTIADSPQDVVDAHDALWVRVAAVVNDGALGLHPHVTPVFGQHTVLSAHCLALSTHCTQNRATINMCT